ncbi:MAG: CapA family protein [Fimbriimonadaceae bacterium]|nr:CapA family protein [Chthonomonadaceae bacterium]MCO5296872.1 CapA family protein [Fimbriimonadaceae bacterium]
MLATLSVLAAGTWTLLLGGDIMLNGVPAGSEPLKGIAATVQAADVAIANLEIPLTGASTSTRRKTVAELKARTQFILKANPAHAAHLADTGWDAVSLGNNHAMDYGNAGLAEMLRTLGAAGIAWAGAGPTRLDAKRPAVLEFPTHPRIAFVSMLAYRTRGALWKCTPATASGAGVFDLDLAGADDEAIRERTRRIVALARHAGEFVIVALHGGVERTSVPTAYQVKIARMFVDAGASVVVGHHPHVLQGAELYRGRPILYSVGNLVSPLPASTALFRLTFDGARLVQFEAVPCRIAGGKTKPVDPGRAAQPAEAFDILCQNVSKSFPAPEAKALGSAWRAK